MAVAYTPGLRVVADTVVREERRLPMQGEVLVTAGQSVGAEDPVARAELPGNLHTIRAAEVLGVDTGELPTYMVVKVGEQVGAGDIVAQSRGLWGLFRSEVRSPISGTLEEVVTASGHVRIREAPRVTEVYSHIAGRVAEIIEREGAVVEARAAFVQGIFGVGGERRGKLRLVSGGPSDMVRADQIADCEGCVLVGGAGIDREALRAAAELGAAGVVVGAVSDDLLGEYVGYDIGVAITGQEEVAATLIVTEGFGELAMAPQTWELLRSLEGQIASIDGSTQIRAGVVRPEVIVPHARPPAEDPPKLPEQVLSVGSRVRLIREPHFGALGSVAELPPALTQIESESLVRIAVVKLDGGRQVQVPRPNLELVQG